MTNTIYAKAGSMTEQDIEREIARLVNKYAAAQKRYHGDSQASRNIELQVDGWEIELKKKRGEWII